MQIKSWHIALIGFFINVLITSSDLIDTTYSSWIAARNDAFYKFTFPLVFPVVFLSSKWSDKLRKIGATLSILLGVYYLFTINNMNLENMSSTFLPIYILDIGIILFSGIYYFWKKV